MKFTVETILKNTDDDELFCLFGEFLSRLIENVNKNLSLEDIVFLDRDKIKVIREMKND